MKDCVLELLDKKILIIQNMCNVIIIKLKFFFYSGFRQKILKVVHITLKKIAMNLLGRCLKQVIVMYLLLMPARRFQKLI